MEVAGDGMMQKDNSDEMMNTDQLGSARLLMVVAWRYCMATDAAVTATPSDWM